MFLDVIKRVSIYFWISIIYFICSAHNHSTNYPLLLISFDGFRHDYIDLAKASGLSLPNFDYFISSGVKAESMIPSFTSITFPNHFTLVTGMYEENHGIVANAFYDPNLNKTFNNAHPDAMDPIWWNNGTSKGSAEPIWITNERDNFGHLKKRSGVFFWPGSESAYGDDLKRPLHYQQYDSHVPYHTRIDTLIKWFKSNKDPINLGLLYIEEPDASGHIYGPDDPHILNKIKELDNFLGYVIGKLKTSLLFGDMNIVITSDHGMIGSSSERLIIVSDHLDTSTYEIYGKNPILHINPHEGKEAEIYKNLSAIEHLHVYYKHEIPRSYHYSYNDRILPIVIVTEEGYSVYPEEKNYTKKGEHGYNNSLSSMHPIFIASGPSFKKGITVKPFENVNVYPLLCHVLDIDPHKNDGNLEIVKHFLQDYKEEELDPDKHKHEGLFSHIFDTTMITYLLVSIFVAAVSGVCCVAACRVYHINIRKLHTMNTMKSFNDVMALPLDSSSTHLLISDSDEPV